MFDLEELYTGCLSSMEAFFTTEKIAIHKSNIRVYYLKISIYSEFCVNKLKFQDDNLNFFIAMHGKRPKEICVSSQEQTGDLLFVRQMYKPLDHETKQTPAGNLEAGNTAKACGSFWKEQVAF